MKQYRSEPLTDKEKRYIRRLKGIKTPFSHEMVNGVEVVEPKKARDYFAPIKRDFVPAKPRGRSGCRLSHEKRMLVLEKASRRAEWFAGLGVRV